MTVTVADAFEVARQLVRPTADTLGTITFLPYVRNGIAATLANPFSAAEPWRPTINVGLTVSDGAGSTPVERSMTLRGPGDVLGFDTRQVIRTYPKPGTHDAEPNYLAHVELDRPDLPWMFTPTGPDAQGRLQPWITLIVVPAANPFTPASLELPARVAARRAELPDLADAWAWAHVQVMGPIADGGHPLAARLSDANPELNLARLVCPLNMRSHTEYRACVVPTFRAGVDAGLGAEISTTRLSPAWSAGPADELIELPVYYEWRFSTGEDGDFESLAQRLRARAAPPGLGVRRLDTTHAGHGVGDVAPDQPGALELVGGPVVSPAFDVATGPWPAVGARGDLEVALDAPDDAMKTAAADATPAIGPPLYGGTHLARTRVDATPPPPAPPPPWFTDLNLDPRHRVVSGLGTRVVQAEQEELMASAWIQVKGVDAANRDLLLSQFARHVSDRLHARHVKRLPEAALLSVTHLVHSRVLQRPALTVRAAMADSSLPLGVASPAFRRLVRDRGPVARFTPAPDARAGLVVRPDGVTRDWVRTHTPPDGTASVSAAAVAVGGERAEAIARMLTDVPSLPDLLADGLAERITGVGGRNLLTEVVEQVVERLLETTPDPDAMAADRNTAEAGMGRSLLLQAVAERAAQAVPLVRVRAGAEQRLPLPVVDREDGVLTLDTAGLRDTAEQLRRVASDVWDLNLDLHAGIEQQQLQQLERVLAEADGMVAEGLAGGLAALAGVAVERGGPRDIDRSSVEVAGLDLVAKLDPGRTVTARVMGRLRDWPGWVPEDWFAGGRVEQVMATPRFPFPMWEALDRYDRRWMIPGMGELEPSDVVTLLKTNEMFQESFLVGLNAEMARELLWRGYPTDQRGTCFPSFWTHQDEIVAPVHRWTAGDLGDHIRADLKGALVLVVRGELVRRYPDLVAHAQRASGEDADGIPQLDGPLARHLFTAFLAPNILLVGFDLKKDAAADPGQRWWFTLAEHPVGPRFGFDEGPAAGGPGVPHVNDLTWGDLATPEGAFLRATAPALTTTPASAGRWGENASGNGAVSLQLPARAAFRALDFLTALAPDG